MESETWQSIWARRSVGLRSCDARIRLFGHRAVLLASLWVQLTQRACMHERRWEQSGRQDRGRSDALVRQLDRSGPGDKAKEAGRREGRNGILPAHARALVRVDVHAEMPITTVRRPPARRPALRLRLCCSSDPD